MIAVAQEASAHVAANPALAALSGFWEWELGRLAETGTEALERYAAALRHGEHLFFYRERAKQNLRMQRYVDALGDVERGLTLEPDEPELLLTRLRVRLSQGRDPDTDADARRDAERACELGKAEACAVLNRVPPS